jgi:hypothetical protein
MTRCEAKPAFAAILADVEPFIDRVDEGRRVADVLATSAPSTLRT